MTRVINIILYVVVGCLLSVCIIQGCKKIEYRQMAQQNYDKYRNCMDAPVHIDTVNDTIYVAGETIIKPIPVIQKVYDTVYVTKKETWYDSTYRGNGWRFRWRAYALGELSDITFSDFVVPKQIITKTTIVDTCFDKPAEIKPVSHLWLYAKPQVYIYPFSVNSVTVGLNYTRKDRWCMGLGVGFDWMQNKPIGEVSFGINLK
jgi:hypothetical protein